MCDTANAGSALEFFCDSVSCHNSDSHFTEVSITCAHEITGMPNKIREKGTAPVARWLDGKTSSYTVGEEDSRGARELCAHTYTLLTTVCVLVNVFYNLSVSRLSVTASRGGRKGGRV